jgi:hypothetical protein
MDDTYATLTVVSVDGTELVFDQIFKETTVERFKRVICMRKREPADAWEDLKLYANRREMGNDRTLESYSLSAGSIVQAVTSDETISRAPSRAGGVARSVAASATPSKARLVRPPPYIEQPQPIRPPTYAPEPRPAPLVLRTVFINDENGRTHSLNDVPLDIEISNFQGLVGQKTGFEAVSLRIIFGGKQFQPGQ